MQTIARVIHIFTAIRCDFRRNHPKADEVLVTIVEGIMFTALLLSMFALLIMLAPTP
jgi:hypothetical protein